MKKITIIYDQEERRIITQFKLPLYIEVTSPGMFFLTIGEEKTDNKIQMEIPVNYDYVTFHIISLEETDFEDKAYPIIMEITNKFIVSAFGRKQDYVCNANELISSLSKELKELAADIASKHPSYESYKTHVANVPLGF